MRRSSDGLTKLYVGDLGENKKSDLTRLFSKYGRITSIYCDEHKHFAFIEFTSSNDAQRALERTNQKIVNGSKLRVEFAKSDRPTRRDRSPTSLLYSHLQVTANRLPPMQVFRQNHQHSVPTMSSSSSNSRGRSLTPPSMKYLRQSNEIPVRTSIDPFTAQRLPSSAFQRSRNSKSKERKRKRRKSSSSSSSSNEEQIRGPRTPPLDDNDDEKRSNQIDTDSTRKHSKRKSRE